MVLASFLLSAVLTAVVRKAAFKRGFVSQPSADRYNQNAIAMGGGIAIFSTLAFFLLAAAAFVKFVVAPGYLNIFSDSVLVHVEGFLSKIPNLLVVVGCLFVLFALGLYDDKRGLSPLFKLIVQFAVAMIAAVFADIRVEFFIESKVVTSVLSAVWIVLLINVFNFLDNMDGASVGIAVIASSILFVSAALSGQMFIGGIGLLFIGTLLGFLLFNFPPAKIFAGDAGSFVIGFMLGLLTLKTTYYQQTQSGQWYSVFMPLIVMAVPLYDFLSVTALRISQGKSPFVGDTQHFSHRLKKHGLSDRQTVLTLYLATLCTGLGATFLYQVNLTGLILVFIQTFMVLAIIAIFETTIKNDKHGN